MVSAARLGAAALAVVALVGCLPGGTDDPTDQPQDPGTTAGTSTSASPSSPASPTGTTVSTPVPTHTVARKVRKGDDVHLRLEIYALERSGDVVVLDFGIRNLGSEDIVLGKELSKGKRTEDVSGIYLYEPESRLQRWPATVGDDCVCSSDVGVVPPGEVQLLDATFSPPEDGVDEVDVHVPVIGTLTDVPISG